VLITSARGVHGPAMAELALLGMLSLGRRYSHFLANQRERHWEKWPQPLLHGRSLLILGAGASGEALATRCKALGMAVVGVSASRESAPGFDAIVPRERLIEAAARADFLVCLVAYSEATHHIVDAHVLDALRPEAFVLNLSRGAAVDEEALINALAAGRIAGAALDVFVQEPLSPESPLWGFENVIVTPHVGGLAERYPELVLPLLVRNLRMYLEGRLDALENLERWSA
jgi:phosphoglycerate dehydrogenase-like enzyme